MVVETKFFVVKQSIFPYQTQGYWLFFGVVNATISISVCKIWFNNMKLPLQFCEGGFWIWLGGIASACDGRSSGYIGLILAFTFFYNASKVHNMLALMLDPCFKSLNVVKAFIRKTKMIQIVVEYDNKILLPL